MKPCKGCKITKPLDDFYKHVLCADRRLNYCKECVKERERLSNCKRQKALNEVRQKHLSEIQCQE